MSVSKRRYFDSLQFHDGTTTFSRLLILFKNYPSTFPPFIPRLVLIVLPSNFLVASPLSALVELQRRTAIATAPSIFYEVASLIIADIL
jgi:hypothetical protein